mmetsp:Transcript_85588/g.215698  ORF Transcript_85588/g.215698 Transcript_85588/m.215698 type:complete len:234 (+) Transcript_85588:509-1210(+)
MILSKIVGSAVSRRPACKMLSQRPLSSHFFKAPEISSRTRVAAGTDPLVMCFHHFVSLGPKASTSSNFHPGCMYRGNMSRMKIIVGNKAASDNAISGPVKKGPVSEAKPSMTPNCFFISARASHRLWKMPNGGVALYSTACIATKYTSCTRAMRLSSARSSGVAGVNDGPTSEYLSTKCRAMVSLSYTGAPSAGSNSGILPCGFLAKYASDFRPPKADGASMATAPEASRPFA